MDISLEEVKQTLRSLIAEVTGVDPSAIRDETTIDEDLQFPSVTFIELQVAVEEAFDTTLDPVEVVELNSFGLIAEAVYNRIAAAGRG
jgi:acyl carrier protein